MITVVTPADPLTLVSLEEAKAWLKVDYDIDDAIITMLIKSAYSEAERFTNSSFLERTLKASFDTCYYKSPFRLPYGPVKSVSSANFITGSGTESITDFLFLDDRFRPNFPYYTTDTYRHTLEVTYVAGSEVVEESIKEAILKTVFSRYETRGNEVVGTEGIKVSVSGLTTTSMDILRPYIRY